jgi:hypothetical protein
MTLLYLVVVVIVLITLVMIRNRWVYSVRMRLLINDYATYKQLQSYKYMMFYFWVWDINEFIENTNKTT